jgi:hypothetical protein
MKEGLQMNHEFDFDNRELEDSQNIPETLPAEENDLAGTPEEPPEGTDTVLEPVTTQTEDTHTPDPDTSEEQPEPSVCQPAYSQHKGKRAKERKKRKKKPLGVRTPNGRCLRYPGRTSYRNGRTFLGAEQWNAFYFFWTDVQLWRRGI